MGIVVLLVLGLFSLPSEASSSGMRVCYERTPFAPYIQGYDAVQAGEPGQAVSRVMAAASALGIELSLYRATWNRCMKDVAENRAQGLFGAAYAREREARLAYPPNHLKGQNAQVALFPLVYSVFVANHARVNWDGRRFSGIKRGVATPIGYVTENKLDELKVRYPYSLSPKEGLALLARGKLDAYVYFDNVGQQLLQEMGLNDEVKVLPAPFLKQHAFFVFSRTFAEKNHWVASQFWQELEKVSD